MIAVRPVITASARAGYSKRDPAGGRDVCEGPT